MFSTDKLSSQSQLKIRMIRCKYVIYHEGNEATLKKTTVGELEEDDDSCCLLGVLFSG